MALRNDWQAEFDEGENLCGARLICPHCSMASIFTLVAGHREPGYEGNYFYHAILKCNFAPCQKKVYVVTTKNQLARGQNHSDNLTIFPTRDVPNPHESIPSGIGEDWVEAQKAFEVGATKAAAVMCRRVLYGILLEKHCKEHPLHEALKELAQTERLPKVVEGWLGEIKEEGHDAAHPNRALQVSAENVSETIEYTRELLRFIYIEPFELQARMTRKAAGKVRNPKPSS